MLSRKYAGIWGLFVIVAAVALAAPASAPGATASGQLHPEANSTSATTAAISKNITVGSSPRDVEYDPANQEILVANYGSGTVSTISGSTNKVTHTISVGKDPNVMAYDPTNSEMYVVNSGAATLSAIGSGNTVSATITISGTVVGSPVYDPSNGDMYILSEAFSIHGLFFNVSRIDHTTNAVTPITVGSGPNFLIYDNATTEMIVSNGGANSISHVNSSTNSVGTLKLTKGTTPYYMLYNPVSHDVYIVDVGSTGKAGSTGNVSVMTPSHTIAATIKVGNEPTFLTLDPATGTVFVTISGTANSSTGKYPAAKISVISSANKLKATVTVGKEAFTTTYSPATQDLYVPCAQSNATYVLNATTFKLVGSPLATKQYPNVAFYDPVHQEILVFGYSNQSGTPTTTTVTIISATNTVAGTLTLPKGPVGGGAYDPKNHDGYVSNEKAGSVTVIK